MTFEGPALSQLDGTACGGFNCNETAHADEAIRAQRGLAPGTAATWPAVPNEIRDSIYGGGACRGTTLAENVAAVARLYGITMTPRYGLPIADHLTIIRSGCGGTFGMMYSALAGTRWNSSNSGFAGGHQGAVNEVADLAAGAAYPGAAAGTYVRVGDPLANGRWLSSLGRYALRGWQWWPLAIYAAATAGWAGAGLVSGDYTIDTEEAMDAQLTPAIRVNCRAGGTLYAGLAVGAPVVAATWAGATNVGSYGTQRRSDGVLMRALLIDLGTGGSNLIVAWYGEDHCTPVLAPAASGFTQAQMDAAVATAVAATKASAKVVFP